MIERKIIIGLITSTDFLKRIKPLWSPRYLESDIAKRMSSWCWEYYDKYNEAPKKEIESIFYSKLKENKFSKSIAEEIENDILPGLSKEYELTTFNLEYLVEESVKYLNDRHLAIHNEEIEALRTAGRIEEAQKLACEFKPLGGNKVDVNNFILDRTQIEAKKSKAPTLL